MTTISCLSSTYSLFWCRRWSDPVRAVPGLYIYRRPSKKKKKEDRIGTDVTRRTQILLLLLPNLRQTRKMVSTVSFIPTGQAEWQSRHSPRRNKSCQNLLFFFFFFFVFYWRCTFRSAPPKALSYFHIKKSKFHSRSTRPTSERTDDAT